MSTRSPQPPRASYILRVQVQGKRPQLELVCLRTGERLKVASARALWRLLLRAPTGLR